MDQKPTPTVASTGTVNVSGDGSVEADLPGLVHDAHAAAAQLFPDLVVAEVADGGAARQVARGPVAVGRPGRPIGVGRTVAGGVGRGRSRGRGRLVGPRPGRLDVVRDRAGGTEVGRVASVGRDIASPCRAWRIRQVGQRPSVASAGCSATQPGHRYASAAMGRLPGARRRPGSIGPVAEPRAECSVASGVLSHGGRGRRKWATPRSKPRPRPPHPGPLRRGDDRSSRRLGGRGTHFARRRTPNKSAPDGRTPG
jgi:hypothetical protein